MPPALFTGRYCRGKFAGRAKALTDRFAYVSVQGPDLVTTSSELIYSGELTKVSVHGWHQDRFFFLFDHLMVYLKKVCMYTVT